VLAIFYRTGSQWLPLIAAKYVLALGFVGWRAQQRALEERRLLEQFAGIGIDSVYSSGVPLIAAICVLGVVLSIVSADLRWLLVVGAIGALLAIGLLLRWLVFDRWLLQQIKLDQLQKNP